MTGSPGIHHLTALADHAARNRDFYVRILGERLVKQTVNFDDPGTWHLYYGDARGTPGSIATFFVWPDTVAAPPPPSRIRSLAYAIAPEAFAFWEQRLRSQAVTFQPFSRLGETGLALRDPGGVEVELIARPGSPVLTPWESGELPTQMQLRGFAPPTIALTDPEPMIRLLRDVLGMQVAAEEGLRLRLLFANDPGPGSGVDVVASDLEGDSNRRAAPARIHHLAFRAFDLDHLRELRQRVRDFGLNPTGLIDRDYFVSVYFRAPGGILFELATDPPGFTRDEALEALGTRLCLPRQHEHLREELTRTLPPLTAN